MAAASKPTSTETDGLWESRRGAIRRSWCARLFEGGEHGKLAARLAAQVIKAYVESSAGSRPRWRADPAKVDIGAVWNAGPSEDDDCTADISIWTCRSACAASGGRLRVYSSGLEQMHVW